MRGDKNIHIKISKMQAENLAQYFYKDIAEYVSKNHARYLQFIKSETEKGENDDRCS